MRADLHVHSCHSRQSGNLRFLRSRDCYSSPEQVYRTARARGMDVVTITDHDSIEGCLAFLEEHPDADDFIVGEEVSCRLPDGDIEVHLGVYGVTEALHRELQPLRGNVFEVTTCLRERGVFFCLNHLLHFYRGQVPLAAYLRLLADVPALEARNGAMLPAHNGLIERIAEGFDGKTWAVVGGSDAHTLRRIGRTWTEAPGRNTDEFLAALAGGLGRPGGRHGSAAAMSGDVYGVVARYVGSLAGLGLRDHAGFERAACLIFSALSLPCQFLPLTVALWAKRCESREVARAIEAIGHALAVSADTTREPLRQVEA